MRYYLQWGIAYAFAVASAASASLFGFLSSVGPYAYMKALALCLVAFAGCHGPAWASRLRQAYGVPAAFLACLAAVACMTVTLWGGLGTMASGGAELRAERVQAADNATRDRVTLARLQDQRRQLAAARPSAAVSAILMTAKDGTLYKSKLLAELETAKAAERLELEMARVSERLAGAPPPIEADPEANAFAQLTGLSVATAAALKALLVSLALEAAAMVAMLVAFAERKGPPLVAAETGTPALEPIQPTRPRIGIVREARPAPRTAPPAGPRRPAPAVFGSIKKFVAASVLPADGERIELKALWARYGEWCKAGGLTPADIDRFLDEIERLAATDTMAVENDGQKVYCVNVVLAA